jgi:EAL domain-containing protein (putative c-di-GMP-specific phosphodiesterase class I)
MVKKLSKKRLKAKFIEALDKDELVIFHQPIVSTQSNDARAPLEAVKTEALLRWPDKTDSEQSFVAFPDEFIPLTEQDPALMFETTKYVITQVCKQAGALSKRFGNAVEQMTYNINVAPSDLLQDGFINHLSDAIRTNNIDPSNIGIELTERQEVKDIEKTQEIMKVLDEAGIHISLDDYGQGYANNDALTNFPIDTAKIDKEYVLPILNGKVGGLFFKSMVKTAHKLGSNVLAEGVETKEQLKAVIDSGCDFVQGYYIAKPMPFNLFIDWMETNKRDTAEINSQNACKPKQQQTQKPVDLIPLPCVA